METTGAWRPLFEGDEAKDLWASIFEVAAAVESPEPAAEGEPDSDAALWEAGFSSGAAGLAVFYSYLSQARSDEAYADLAMAQLDRALDGLATLPMPPSLYSGFSGVAWAMEHLQGRLFEPEEEEEGDNVVLDALLTLLDQEPWTGDYDLIGGLTGFGVCALEALPHPAARRCLERLVEHFEKLAQPRSGGLAWFTPPELLPAHQREIAPLGYDNLGVAHGVPGVVGLLGEIYGAGIVPERALALLDGAVPWMLGQEWETESGTCFPSFIYEGVKPHPSRLAWCYGDPGLAATLLLAARRAGRADWERAALDIALRCAARPKEASGIRDAGICHGSAGLAHLFNRIYQATGEEELAAAARFWYRRTLELRRPGEGIAGYASWEAQRGGWIARRGFLTGSAGIALALLAAVSSVEPEWDRLLLTAIPPR